MIKYFLKVKKKKSMFFIIFLFASYSSFCQLDHIDVLLWKTDTDVQIYMDSLNSLQNNPYYEFKRTVSSDGDLTFVSTFSITQESKLNCYAIMTLFQRVNGIEICIKQKIIGSLEFANYNLSYIKDNFKFVSENKWEKSFPFAPKFKNIATFLRNNEDPKSYNITYSIVQIE